MITLLNNPIPTLSYRSSHWAPYLPPHPFANNQSLTFYWRSYESSCCATQTSYTVGLGWRRRTDNTHPSASLKAMWLCSESRHHFGAATIHCGLSNRYPLLEWSIWPAGNPWSRSPCPPTPNWTLLLWSSGDHSGKGDQAVSPLHISRPHAASKWPQHLR